MKVSPVIAHELCRAYLNDRRAVLGPLYPKISGYNRSRNIPALAGCSTLAEGDAKNDPQLIGTLLQIEAFFKKNASLSTGVDTALAARTSFERGEKLCRITNRRLNHYYLNRGRLDPDVEQQMAAMEQYIARLLGDFSKFLSVLPRQVRLTDGASANHSRKASRPYYKVGRPIECSHRALPYWDALLKYWGVNAKVRWEHALENRLAVVPKSWKTDRTIACEPSGNLPLQLAFDNWSKERLRMFGVDLASQANNQRLAYEGSLDGSLATIDMSMASDTVAYNLVMWLFPHDWANYLDVVRSPFYSAPWGSGRYAKFSSMGNGSTFTVETMVFYAALKAVGSRKGIAYGDDLIVETELVPALVRLLRFLGFVINEDKSHYTGSFRESCGVHFVNGTLVTPFTIKRFSDKRADLHHNLNNLAAIADPGGELENLIVDMVRSHKLRYVPYNQASTSGIWIDPTSAYKQGLIRKDRHGRLRYSALVFKANKEDAHDWRGYFLWHLAAYTSPNRDFPLSLQDWGRLLAKTEDSVRPLGRQSFWFNQNSLTVISSEGLTLSIERSRDASSSGTYTRRRCGWFPPLAAVPVHLYWWTDRILAREG